MAIFRFKVRTSSFSYLDSPEPRCAFSNDYIADNAVAEISIAYGISSLRGYGAAKERLTLIHHPTIEEGDCSRAGLDNRIIYYNYTPTMRQMLRIWLCMDSSYGRCCYNKFSSDIDVRSIKWDAATKTCHITAEWDSRGHQGLSNTVGARAYTCPVIFIHSHF